MSRATIEKRLGVGDKNYRPLLKRQVSKTEEIMIKSKNPVPDVKLLKQYFS